MTFHPTLFQVRYAEDLPPEGTEIPRGYGDLLYHFKEKRAESFPNCPEKNKHFTYELPIRTGIDYDNVYFFVILNTQSMRSTDTVKITMFGNSNTNRGKLDQLREHPFRLMSLHLDIAQIAIGPPPPALNRALSGALFFRPFFTILQGCMLPKTVSAPNHLGKRLDPPKNKDKPI